MGYICTNPVGESGCLEVRENRSAVCPRCGVNDPVYALRLDTTSNRQEMSDVITSVTETLGRQQQIDQLGIIARKLLTSVWIATYTSESEGRQAIIVKKWSNDIPDQAEVEYDNLRYFKRVKSIPRDLHLNHDAGVVVMTYMPGVNLLEWIKVNTVTPELISAVCGDQIPNILHQIHRDNHLYVDLKEGNVILRPQSNSCSLIDFESLVEIDDPLSNQAIYTPTHIGPEFYDPNRRTFSPALNVYGLSVIAYRMIAGDLPVDANRRWFSMVEHGVDPLVDLANYRGIINVHPSVVSAVMAGLTYKPEDRPQTISAYLEMFWDGQVRSNT